MSEYVTSYNPQLEQLLPDGLTKYQKLIRSTHFAANWLECASFKEYPLEVRLMWWQLGKQWLDLSMRYTGPGFEFKDEYSEWILHYELDRAEVFWDLTTELNSYVEY